MDHPPKNRGRRTLPEEVQREEEKYVRQRRKAVEHGEDQPLVGLALSGGGIRSATFALGVLQGLARRNVLRIVDYLCTVSGGGYIGSCLSSLLTERPGDPMNEAGRGKPWDKSQFNLEEDNFPLTKFHQVHHLRKHGDFLIVRKGLFRREVLRTVGTFLVGILSSLAMFLFVLSILVGLLYWFGHVFGEAVPEPLTDEGPQSVWEVVHGAHWDGWPGTLDALAPDTAGTQLILAVGVGFGLMFALAVAWVPQTVKGPRGETGPEKAERHWLWLFSAVLFLVIGVMSVLVVKGAFSRPAAWNRPLWKLSASNDRPATAERFTGQRSGHLDLVFSDEERGGRIKARVPAAIAGPPRSPKELGRRFPCLLLPAAGFLGVFAALGLVYLVIALVGSEEAWNLRYRSLFGAMQGIAFFLAVVGGVGVALIVLLWWMRSERVHFMDEIGMVLGLVLTRLFARPVTEPDRPKTTMQWLKTRGRHYALQLAVPVFIISAIVVGADWVVGRSDHVAMGTKWVPLGGLAGVLVVGFLVNFNRVSLHYFYRDRLAEAYLQTEAHATDDDGGDESGAPQASVLTRVRDDYDLKLAELHDRGGQAEPSGNPAPYHLLLCALNLPGSRDLDRKDRKSDHFIFSRLFCGSRTTGYAPTEEYRQGETRLCTAMTISGAAASSSMGFQTSFAQAFAMTLFNVRLGYWLENPIHLPSTVYAPDRGPYPPGPVAARFPKKLRKLGRALAEKLPTFWPIYLLQEVTAATNASRSLVNLSDGGHTGDNIGLYPLLQRRCRLIIVSDAERDPEYVFSSLTAAIRQIYIDENVEVDFDVDRIRPEMSGGRPKTHYAIGRITYPVRDERGTPAWTEFEEEPYGPYGWILYLKSSFCDRDEAGTVKGYAARHDEFPHETTADQFFNDAQFEAYRALGAVIAEGALQDAGLKDPPDPISSEELVDLLIRWCEEEFLSQSGGTGGPAFVAADPEARKLRDALEANNWNRAATARQLGLHPSTVRRRMEKYGIEPPS